MIAEAAKMLKAGEDGLDVVEFLREQLQASAERDGKASYSTNTLKTYVSHTKTMALTTYESDCRNPHCDFAALTGVADNADDVDAFVVAPLKVQLEIQRRHRANPTWNDEAEDALASLQLLKDSIASFAISKREVRWIKRKDKANMQARWNSVVVVTDGAALLERATTMLERARPSDGYVTLLAPLLLVSGRREIEILNTCSGRASFEKVGERTVRFTGQCKTKRSEGAPPFVIPLLCTADVFLRAIAALQEKRGDVSGLTNKELHEKMDAFFTAAFLQRAFPTLLPESAKWHTLRSFYLQFVNVLFAHSKAVNWLGTLILGHFDEHESLRYNATRIDGLEAWKGAFGALELGEEAA
jgi:hypothetical protein